MLEKVNLLQAVNSAGLFEYLHVGHLNGHALSVLQAENRTLDFHVHEQSDELFYVIEGQFDVELDDGIVSLAQGDLLIIPRGTRHRPMVTQRVKCLLMELDGTLNAGNTGGALREEWAYQAATPAQLERRWEINIADNPGDLRWPAWKAAVGEENRTGRCKTFVALRGGEPVGEGTLLLSPACGAIGGRLELADGAAVANINALRIEKAYEDRGHISRLVRAMEAYAAGIGIRRLTIGVEAGETRNLAIYLHWGFTEFVAQAMEDGEPVLYYAKDIGNTGGVA